MSDSQFQKMLDKVWKKKWNVWIKEKYSHGKGVLTYLARYIRGGPISNRRIVKIENGRVTFHVGREKKELLTLPIEEFIRRFLDHIPQTSSIRVRSYGIYSSTSSRDLDTCQRLLGAKPLEENAEAEINWQDILEDCFTEQAKDTPWQCPVCGKRLIVKATIPPARPVRLSEGDPPSPDPPHSQ